MPIMKESGLQVLEVCYDFGVDSGEVGTYELTNSRGVGRFPVGAIIVDCYLQIRGTLAGESGASIALGHETTATAYIPVTQISNTPANYVDNVKNFDDNGLRTFSTGTVITAINFGNSTSSSGNAVTEYRQNAIFIDTEAKSKVLLTISGNTINSGQVALFFVFLNPTYTQING
jgi:hypothetical protein